MIKKLVSLCVGVSCLLAFSQADAFEYSKKAIMKEFKCKSGDTVRYATQNWSEALTKVNRVYENDTIKVETFINIYFDNLIISGNDRKYLADKTIIIAVAGNPMMGFNTEILVAPAVTFRITNKTSEPMEFDLDHSQITVGTYQGRGVQSGTKYNGAATSVQAPVMIFPKATKDIMLWRTDHDFYDGYYLQGKQVLQSKWLPPFDVVPDKNLLGDMILCIDKKYITFTPEAVIPRQKLKWEQIKK